MRVGKRSVYGLESMLVVLGVAFMVLSVVSVLFAVGLIVALPNPDIDFPDRSGLPINPATMRTAKVFGILLFGLLALIAYAVADLLLEHPLGRLRRRLRNRRGRV
jgi:hypothetical protein